MKYNYIVFQKPTANLIKPNKGGRRSKRGCHNGRGKHYRRHLFDTQSHVTLSLGKLSVAGLLQPREGKQRCVCAGRGGINLEQHLCNFSCHFSGNSNVRLETTVHIFKRGFYEAEDTTKTCWCEVSDGNKRGLRWK